MTPVAVEPLASPHSTPIVSGCPPLCSTTDRIRSGSAAGRRSATTSAVASSDNGPSGMTSAWGSRPTESRSASGPDRQIATSGPFFAR